MDNREKALQASHLSALFKEKESLEDYIANPTHVEIKAAGTKWKELKFNCYPKQENELSEKVMESVADLARGRLEIVNGKINNITAILSSKE